LIKNMANWKLHDITDFENEDAETLGSI